MNKKTDVLIIGAGLSGLMAAAKAAESGKKVTVAAKGMGSLSLSSGCIDLWGYDIDDPQQVCPNPLAQIARLGEVNREHPYTKVADVLEESLRCFQGITARYGCDYRDNGGANWLLPTAVGTFRPSFLAPPSMAVKDLDKAKRIVIAGYEELKDFYPEVMAANLARNGNLPESVNIAVVKLRCAWKKLYATTLAHRLEQAEGIKEAVDQIKPHVVSGTVVLFPPVLGERLDIDVAARLSAALGAPVYEVANIPPALPGQRLQQLLLKHLRNMGVDVIIGCTFTGAKTEGNRCLQVTAEGAGKTFTFAAQTYVLATGAFVGGGLDSRIGAVREMIFDLPVCTLEKWASGEFLSMNGHGFNRFGIAVNDRLQPLDEAGQVCLENVRITGANLAGANGPIEKCGNGVALASGYKAGKLAGEVPS
ncbi:anaerobic glycerol-3-phosphate dehydrogenase subunit B [Heliobacterium gestii]|uniref:Anaerobic glycerol-3-phosphate dehydrogenase subunit B n=1 Tax=Heliomicrobium gestii TaxID=2699 RepID=A0A845LBL3_HELGE|nr:anaerobic glycerol-3-phosphate dehydrogenase subunit GlpB [Heliomicrobium gestii]MBM7865960.1 glycerol-3-phosphate dehydrogenase subunit B [Heliomicrobium gestii]MZP42704.1 anaerobic glycerol-3-phosphate dehydrogenase subunit B [Heliomicrobium gestii]